MDFESDPTKNRIRIRAFAKKTGYGTLMETLFAPE